LEGLPAAVDLVKTFEGFRSSAYLDTNGLPVIGYGQTKVNGQTVSIGQYITQIEAAIALEQGPPVFPDFSRIGLLLHLA
jgi:lysozyme